MIMADHSLLPDDDPFRRVDAGTWTRGEQDAVLATDDREAIRRWAAERRADPATGEATRSGPATRDVQDGGTGLRFNFPGAALFRPIGWDEWFENFQARGLLFVYERETPGRPPGNRYRLVRKSAVDRSTEPVAGSRAPQAVGRRASEE
jgi:hypothetical protein